jgi:hypothetical protein
MCAVGSSTARDAGVPSRSARPRPRQVFCQAARTDECWTIRAPGHGSLYDGVVRSPSSSENNGSQSVVSHGPLRAGGSLSS